MSHLKVKKTALITVLHVILLCDMLINLAVRMVCILCHKYWYQWTFFFSCECLGANTL